MKANRKVVLLHGRFLAIIHVVFLILLFLSPIPAPPSCAQLSRHLAHTFVPIDLLYFTYIPDHCQEYCLDWITIPFFKEFPSLHTREVKLNPDTMTPL